MKKLRRYVVAGLLLWVPLGVTILVLKVLVDLMDRSLLLIPTPYRPENLFGFNIPGLGVVLTALVLVATGMLVANFFGRRLVAFGESVVHRIPIVRTVYSGAKRFVETVFMDGSTAFKRVVLIQYPRAGIWSLAFVTSTDLAEVQARTEGPVVCCFVPTTPNPTSGFIVMVPKDDVIQLDMEVEDALKMVISLGVVVPRWVDKEQAVAELARPTGSP